MNMRTKKPHARVLPVLAVCLSAGVAAAQYGQPAPAEQRQPPQQAEQPRPMAAEAAQRPAVVATVNGDPITKSEVQASVRQQLGKLQSQQQGAQGIDPRMIQQLQTQVVEGLIESRLVEQYAVEQGPGISDEEVEATVNRLESDLQQRGSSLDQYLQAQGQTAESFESRIEGSLAWQKLQQQQLTDEKLKQYFEANKEQFQAEDYQQARDQVAGRYIDGVWRQIVSQTRPEAEIEVSEIRTPPQPGAGQPMAPPAR